MCERPESHEGKPHKEPMKRWWRGGWSSPLLGLGDGVVVDVELKRVEGEDGAFHEVGFGLLVFLHFIFDLFS